MELVLQKEMDMPLLERKRFTFNLVFEGATPKKDDVKKQVASQLKVHDDIVVLKHVFQRYGSKTAKVIAHVYKSAEMLKKFEPKKKVKKQGAA